MLEGEPRLLYNVDFCVLPINLSFDITPKNSICGRTLLLSEFPFFFLVTFFVFSMQKNLKPSRVKLKRSRQLCQPACHSSLWLPPRGCTAAPPSVKASNAHSSSSPVVRRCGCVCKQSRAPPQDIQRRRSPQFVNLPSRRWLVSLLDASQRGKKQSVGKDPIC